MTPQRLHPVVPTLREAEAAGNISDADMDQHLLRESASGDSLPDVLLPDDHFPDGHITVARLDGLVREHRMSPHIADEAMVAAFGLGSGSGLFHCLCSNL